VNEADLVERDGAMLTERLCRAPVIGAAQMDQNRVHTISLPDPQLGKA
jgi:hypothetical protein